jgi:hypothetical protein
LTMRNPEIKSTFTFRPRAFGYLAASAILFSCSVLCAQKTATPGQSQTPAGNPIAMAVDSRQISVAELCSAIATLPPPQATGFPLHPALAAEWYGPLIALAEEAKREHLGQAFLHDDISHVDQANALSAELIRKIASHSEPTEAQIEQYYAAYPAEFARTRAQHILISYAGALASRSSRSTSEAMSKADDIAAQLKQGADFAALAAKESDDPYTKAAAGDLGDVAHNQMEPDVDHVIWSLSPGETSSPFRGRFGYEIVHVQSRRTLPLNEVRPSITGNLKFLATTRRRQEIISAAHISLKRMYMDSQLPCAVNAAALTN